MDMVISASLGAPAQMSFALQNKYMTGKYYNGYEVPVIAGCLKKTEEREICGAPLRKKSWISALYWHMTAVRRLYDRFMASAGTGGPLADNYIDEIISLRQAHQKSIPKRIVLCITNSSRTSMAVTA